MQYNQTTKPKEGKMHPVIRASIVSSILLLNAPVLAAPTPDDQLATAKQYLDAGKPLVAKKSLTKLRAQLEKDAEQKAKLVDVLILLGQASESAQAFADAEEAYSKALDTTKQLNLDQTGAKAHLDKLHEKYRPIDFTEVDKDRKISEMTKNAGAVTGQTGSHVSVELAKPIKQSTDEFLKTNPQAAQAQEQAQSQIQSQDGTSKEKSPQLKSVRLEKKIGFDVVQEKDKVRVQNIEGVNLNVGLWVKLKEVVLSINENDPQPGIDVTAGKFGVEKTVHIGLPQDAIKQVRKGLQIMDPFFKPQAAAAAELTPGNVPDPAPSPVPTQQNVAPY